MADKPINQAPEVSTELYSLYGRKNTGTNDLIQVPKAKFANAVNFTVADKGKLPYINASGDFTNLAPGTDGNILRLNAGLPVWDDALIDTQTFTGSGTWTKPTGATFCQVWLWGAGAGGGNGATVSNNSGGGGGACVVHTFLASALSATETVTIGAGGGPNAVGGNSTFGSRLTAYGGGAFPTGSNNGGTGGGWLSAGGTGVTGGAPRETNTELANAAWGTAFGGGISVSARSSGSVYGGGGGGLGGAGTGIAGGSSFFGGGGGGGGGNSGGGAAGGTSVVGGAGGAGGVSTAAGGNGTQPGGGGGGSFAGTGGTGGAGKCIVYSW